MRALGIFIIWPLVSALFIYFIYKDGSPEWVMDLSFLMSLGIWAILYNQLEMVLETSRT
jgi:hypothetical protein